MTPMPLSRELVDALAALQTVTFVRMTQDGFILEANDYFLRIAGIASRPDTPWPGADLFLQPTFARLKQLVAPVGMSDFCYRGIFNLGREGTTPVSLKGSLRRSGEHLFFIAEHDLAELDHLQNSVLQLNEELAETQRRLVRDLRERKRIESELRENQRGILALHAELEEKAQSLERISALKSRFLSYMSHEFRTPLSAIQNLSRLLLDRLDGELTADQEIQVTMIRDSTTSLFEMVNELLDLARIEAGKTVIRREEFDVSGLFASLRGLFRPIFETGEVSLSIEEPTELPRLLTDERKLAQILRNLISNARKFTESGCVNVSARPAEPAEIIFTVTDTGIGIEAKDLNVIFEEFGQIDGTVQRKVDGTGLGLALSRKLARILGGDLEVMSKPGSGTSFDLRIPIVYSGSEEINEVI